MNYILEGTISELTAKGNGYLFKITGIEGFAIKQSDKIYNVFRPENIVTANGNLVPAFIIPDAMEMQATNSSIALVSSAMAGGKRVRIEVGNTEIEIITEVHNTQQERSSYQLRLKRNPLPISSITLLAH